MPKKRVHLTYLPNFITVLRGVMALLILLVTPFSMGFYLLYVLCGVTDLLDGYLARKLNVVSKLGQSLDSLADLLFFISVAIRVLPWLPIQWWMIIWMLAICLLKGISLVIGFIRFRRISFLHTYVNKATGLLLFASPVFIELFGVTVCVMIVSAVATFAAIEEQILLLRLRTLQRDVKGIFEVKNLP